MDFNDAMTEAIEHLEEEAKQAHSNGYPQSAAHLQDIAETLAKKHWPADYPAAPEGHYRLSELTLSDLPDALEGMTMLVADKPEDIEAWPPATHVLGGECYRTQIGEMVNGAPITRGCECGEVGPLFKRQRELQREMQAEPLHFPDWHVLWSELNDIGKSIASYTVIDLGTGKVK